MEFTQGQVALQSAANLSMYTRLTCPIKPILSAVANENRGAVQLAAELGELSIAAIKQGAGLTVGGVVVIDQGS
jgi:hypothetical protein